MFYLHLTFLKGGEGARQATNAKQEAGTVGSWIPIVDQGGVQHPGPLGHHTNVVVGKKSFLYGGIMPNQEVNNTMYVFDSISHSWNKVLQRGLQPTPRDQHTANVWEDKMIVFGGFENGSRVNTIQVYNFIE